MSKKSISSAEASPYSSKFSTPKKNRSSRSNNNGIGILIKAN